MSPHKSCDAIRLTAPGLAASMGALTVCDEEKVLCRMRVMIDQDPYFDDNITKPWDARGAWPCAWICCPDAGEAPFVTAYRRRFALERPATIRAHVSADERYELFLDGERVGRGSERGAPDSWFFETYDFTLDGGEHTFVARVWSLGERAAFAQMQVHPGFIFSPEGAFVELLGTGVAPWEAKRLDGYTFLDPTPAKWRGDTISIDGASFPWGFERGAGEDWAPASKLALGVGRRIGWEFRPLHLLRPATLPPMVRQKVEGARVRLVAQPMSIETRAIPVRAEDDLPDEAGWTDFVRGEAGLTIPPHTLRRVIVDLEGYYCAFPEVVTSGGRGSAIRILWTEALFHEPRVWGGTKGHRDEIEGKYFDGIGDTFLPDGGARRRFETLWWEAGRYLEVLVETADEPLRIDSFTLYETHYPLEMESEFAANDPRLSEIMPILVRGIQMCAHETYMDCPYYEELMYAGDTRLEILTTYCMTRDDRLPRKALRMFDLSRLPSGLTQARYPSRILQIIAPFALWWVAMVRDYALWRDDRALVEQLMPGVRATIEAFRRFLGADQLMHAPEGWNTIDWVPAWPAGMPPEAASGVSGVLNWQLALVMRDVAELEALLGEHELAARGRRLAAELAARLDETFWDERRGLYADDPAKQRFSEHTQCLAILSGQLGDMRRARVAEGLLHDPDLDRATIYFSHYLFEAYRELGRIDALIDRLDLWFDLKAQGFKTPVEMPEPSRSDCHGWGAHPLYHYFASILGIRPGGLGFGTVEIRPQLGPLGSARGTLVHPKGEIVVEARREDGALHGSLRLPPGVTGSLHDRGRTISLPEGERIDF